jgi:hypothetical protein
MFGTGTIGVLLTILMILGILIPVAYLFIWLRNKILESIAASMFHGVRDKKRPR